MIIYVNGEQIEVGQETVEIYHPPFWRPQPKPKESDTVSNENTQLQMPEM